MFTDPLINQVLLLAIGAGVGAVVKHLWPSTPKLSLSDKSQLEPFIKELESQIFELLKTRLKDALQQEKKQ